MAPRRVAALLALAAGSEAAWTGMLGLEFASDRPTETKSLHCPSGFITGIRVRYGRTRSEDRDLYDFKLKCGNRWTSWSGLWFKNEVEDKEWECPSKMYVTGMEVSAAAPTLVTATLTTSSCSAAEFGRAT